ncbi:MAG: response regulator transcription factor [Chloroflexi bacterium]|nr:response regulator transcription factor [Chloroflexota bacterium]
MARSLGDPSTEFNERELEILRRIAEGQSNREIADQLFLSVNTVRWYNKQIYEKLDTHSRTTAIARARALGLLTAGGDGARTRRGVTLSALPMTVGARRASTSWRPSALRPPRPTCRRSSPRSSDASATWPNWPRSSPTRPCAC